MTIIKNYHHFFLNNQSTVFRLFQQTLDKLEKLNREIHHKRKTEKVAVIVENIQITEIWSA
ncbi:MAG: hypothetical protein MGU50_15525 [Trichodesmium sp. MAG_R02]|jgi:hypothetical protein|nr:hypothetical protein [Trichodesmium sp. MAG_R02]